MNRMIFVNLPVADVTVTRNFYEGLGFSINPQFCDEQTACIVVSDTIFVMALERPRFADFVAGELAAPGTTEVINCLSAESREEVDGIVAKALANGGKPWQDVNEDGPMYGHSFADPDGHAWEVLYMEQPQA